MYERQLAGQAVSIHDDRTEVLHSCLFLQGGACIWSSVVAARLESVNEPVGCFMRWLPFGQLFSVLFLALVSHSEAKSLSIVVDADLGDHASIWMCLLPGAGSCR